MILDGDVDVDDEKAFWDEFLELLRKHNAVFSGYVSGYDAADDVYFGEISQTWPQPSPGSPAS